MLSNLLNQFPNPFRKSGPTQTPLEQLGPRTGDEGPYELIYRAYLLGWIHFGTRLAMLNRPKSPVYNFYENWGPVGLVVFLALYYGFTRGLQAGLAVLGGGVFLGIFILPRYVLKKLRMRVLELAFGSEAGWRELWATGGLTMRLALAPDITCDSPDGDWEEFARTYLDRTDEDGPPKGEDRPAAAAEPATDPGGEAAPGDAMAGDAAEGGEAPATGDAAEDAENGEAGEDRSDSPRDDGLSRLQDRPTPTKKPVSANEERG